jgi:hypothetical protein
MYTNVIVELVFSVHNSIIISLHKLSTSEIVKDNDDLYFITLGLSLRCKQYYYRVLNRGQGFLAVV